MKILGIGWPEVLAILFLVGFWALVIWGIVKLVKRYKNKNRPKDKNNLKK